MDGVTDEPTRQIQCSIAKPSVIYTEFVSVEGFFRNPKAFAQKLAFQENQRPIVVQFFGYTPEIFFEAISQVLETYKFDGIDINMGCPAKSVIQKGGGGELIGNYPLVEKIITKSLLAIEKSKKSLPLSVKTRIGKNKPITEEWIKFLTSFPLSELTVHGRILKQSNSGPVNWEEIKKGGEIAKKKKIIYLGNGGIKSYQEAVQKTKNYSTDGVLIGQAAFGNPWVFKENYQPKIQEILQTIIGHCRLVEKFYSPQKFSLVYKYLSWYPKEFPYSTRLKTELLKCKNTQEVVETIDKFVQAHSNLLNIENKT